LKLVRGFMAPPTFTVARQADLYYKSPTDASLGPHPFALAWRALCVSALWQKVLPHLGKDVRRCV
jgi:hypothetical protein